MIDFTVFSAHLDSRTEEDLVAEGGDKWTRYPGCLGAFIAETDFGTPPAVAAAIREASGRGLGYLSVAHAERLSRACAAWQLRLFERAIDPEWIRPCPDVLEIFQMDLAWFHREGSAVIVPTPAYMPFLAIPRMLGIDVIEVPMLPTGHGYEYDFDGIDQAFRSGAGTLILCNPHNPIGKVATRAELVRIEEIVDCWGGRVFSDEIHAPLMADRSRYVPYAGLGDAAAGHTLTATSASKAYNIAGTKCAEAILSNVADVDVWRSRARWSEHQTSVLGVIASVAAFEDDSDWLDAVVRYLDRNRAVLGSALARLAPDVDYLPPEATYIAWLGFPGARGDVAAWLRDRAHVATTDGRACGEAGVGHVRLNFALPRPLLVEAVRRMASALESEAMAAVTASASGHC